MEFMKKYSDLVFFIVAVFYLCMRVFTDFSIGGGLQLGADIIVLIGAVMFIVSMVHMFISRRKNKST
nr:hypothetical protein [Niallia taxi]